MEGRDFRQGGDRRLQPSIAFQCEIAQWRRGHRFGPANQHDRGGQRIKTADRKVDRSFVHSIGIDGEDAAICSAIIGLARSLHLDVVAEGVETQAQYDWLAKAGCHTIQGYFTGRPAPAASCLSEFQLTAGT